MKASGDVRVTVLFVDFPDGIASATPQSAFAVFSTTGVDFFREMSYGATTIVFEPVFRWVRMSKPAGDYGFNALTFQLQKTYMQEAINVAGASVDYSRTDAILVVANPDASSFPRGNFAFTPSLNSEGLTAGGRLIANGATSGSGTSLGQHWTSHELGHSLGLPDLYQLDGSARNDRSVGSFSIMAGSASRAAELFAWERWVTGWVSDSQVACVTSGTTTVTLTPVERSGGNKMVVVPLSSTQAVVAESRRNEGRDSGLTPGVLVYLVDSAVASLQGPIKVLPLDDADQTKLTKSLIAGRSLTFNGVTITVVSSDANGDVVTVSK